MSFSSEVKKSILSDSQNIKKDCCRSSFRAGVNGGEYVSRCSECDRYFIAGVFFTYGSVSDPEKTSNLYIFAPKELLDKVNETLSKHDLAMRESKRRGKDILYIRKNNEVEDFLTFIGASQYSVKAMQINVIKTIKIEQNRANNAEVANLDRSSTAAAEQIIAIKTLIDDKRLYKLPEEYVRTAEMRLEHPDLSLSELAKLFDKEITKSGLGHRLKKLVLLSKQHDDE